MFTCPFRTKACTLSTPCPKCRQFSIHAAHALGRVDAKGQQRGRRAEESHTHYQSKHGGYWERPAA